MNFAAFERAQVAAFAYREARHTGSLDCMRAVCFVLRNRVKAGWAGASWLKVMAGAAAVAGNVKTDLEFAGESDPSDRLLQLIIRDVDDIYLGQESFDDNVRRVVCSDDPKKPALYYSFVDRDPRPWFVENVVRKPADHPQIGQIGTMMLYR
jgi:hypothetical protein